MVVILVASVVDYHMCIHVNNVFAHEDVSYLIMCFAFRSTAL